MFPILAGVAMSVLTKAKEWVTPRRALVSGAIALTAILMAILLYQVRQGRRDQIALTEQLQAAQGEVVLLRQARDADATATATVAGVKRDIEVREVSGRAKTEAAIAANPDWAQQPIPADIIDSLRD